MIQPKRIGNYLNLTDGGFLVRRADLSLVQAKWLPILEKVKEFILAELGQEIHSIYIRGSVACGGAVDGVSDLDTICVTKTSIELSEASQFFFRSQLVHENNFCTGLEVYCVELSDLNLTENHTHLGVWEPILKTQCVCIYGNDLSNLIRPIALSDMFLHLKDIEIEIARVKQDLDKMNRESESSELTQMICTWIMKRILRSAFEMVMIREQKYTRDLYLCMESAAKHYPKKKELLNQALLLALNPIQSPSDLLKVVQEFEAWFQQEKISLN